MTTTTVDQLAHLEPAHDEAQHWTVQTRSGLTVHVPPSLRSLTTFILLEQESWFEPEMSLLPHLLAGGVHTLDIGANHGVYTLEMARCSGSGKVWAFEPTRAPRTALLRSVAANQFADRVTVIGAALADQAGQAQFEVGDNSELNARVGNTVRGNGEAPGQQFETVRVDTLDAALKGLRVTEDIGFVKLDAEGDELRVLAGAKNFFAQHSPVVMFEFKHGQQVNTELLAAFDDLGYGVFRWSAALELLLPFDLHSAETAFALNLVALRPAQQTLWGERGLLVTGQALREATAPTLNPGMLGVWCQLLGMDALASITPQEIAADSSAAYADALLAVVSAHLDASLSGAQRALLVAGARNQLQAAAQATTPTDGNNLGLEDWALLVHCQQALGAPLAAVQLGNELLANWPQNARLRVPFVPPQLAQSQRLRSTDVASWLHQMLAEFVSLGMSYSSYFEAPSLSRWAVLLDHPDHSAEVERRYLLAAVLTDKIAPTQQLHHLAPVQQSAGQVSPAGANAGLWHGLMASMQKAALDEPPTPDEVLAALPVVAVTVVDVGASSLGNEAEPYAPLVQRKRAQVTGFEPDAQALAVLQQQRDARAAANDAGQSTPTHTYLPHFVGNGQAATFYETEWSLTGSLFEPNRSVLDSHHNLGELVQEKARHAVTTVRLDSVLPAGSMDMLKIDVQGAECQVFEGATQRLNECLLVWTEVEFVPLYKNQPLFADVDARLRQSGLQFLCFAGIAPRTLASWPVTGVQQPQRPQQLWADALYIPGPERLATLSADACARLALLAHHVAASFDVCHAALLRFDELTGDNFAPRYLESMRTV